MEFQITPMPPNVGYGFTSYQQLPQTIVEGYRYEPAGRYHNYHFTPTKFGWPVEVPERKVVLEGFAPNLNKKLHIGHLRNLVLASSLDKLLPASECTGMLGAALGEIEGAEEELSAWCGRATYVPHFTKDTSLHVELLRPTRYGTDEIAAGTTEQRSYDNCKMWDGPLGPVVVIRSDGRPTYAGHDLMYAQVVKPDLYVTGAEQGTHFKTLGLGDKHVPMGLVVGTDGKKISSRNITDKAKFGGIYDQDDAGLTASDTLNMIMQRLEDTPDREQLAWNILAYNFLSVGRTSNCKFHVDEWTQPDRPGLYITYTYARVMKALESVMVESIEELDPKHMYLIAASSYTDYWVGRARKAIDPNPIATYALELAKVLTKAYHEERIIGGTKQFVYAISCACASLGYAMRLMTMHRLTRV